MSSNKQSWFVDFFMPVCLAVVSPFVVSFLTTNYLIRVFVFVGFGFLLLFYLAKNGYLDGAIQAFANGSRLVRHVVAVIALLCVVSFGTYGFLGACPMVYVVDFDDSFSAYDLIYVATINSKNRSSIRKGYECDDGGVAKFKQSYFGYDFLVACKINWATSRMILTIHNKIRGKTVYTFEADKPEYVILHVESIYFDLDSVEINKRQDDAYDRIVRVLENNPGSRIVTFGHTDFSGGEGYNERLSVRRIRSLLRALGVGENDPKRLLNLAFGERLPRYEEEDRQDENRRVDVLIVSEKQTVS